MVNLDGVCARSKGAHGDFAAHARRWHGTTACAASVIDVNVHPRIEYLRRRVCVGLIAVSFGLPVACGDTTRSQSVPVPEVVAPASQEASSAPSVSADTPVRVTARVSGHRGQPLRAWGVRVTRMGMNSVLLSQEFEGGDDGRLTFEVPEPGLYEVELHGTDHAGHTMPVWIQGEVELEGRLGTYARAAVKDVLDLKLQWVKGDTVQGQLAETVQAHRVFESKTRFVAKPQAPEGVTSVRVQIAGWAVDRTVNVPRSPRVVFDGGGDYWSEYPWPTSNGSLTVDLKDVPPADIAAAVTLHGAGEVLGPVQTRSARLVQEATDLLSAKIEAASDEMDPEKVRLDALAEALDMLTARVPEMPEGLARASLVLHIVLFERAQRPPTERIGARTWGLVRDHVAPDAVAWAALQETFGVYTIAEAMVEDSGWDAYLDALARHPEPSVRALVLDMRHWMARRDGEFGRARAMYQQLRDEYSDVASMMVTLHQYDPKRPIQPGKPMLEWSFPRLDQSGPPLTSQSMKGTPYVFDVWGTWCGGCVADMPMQHATYAAINGVEPPRPSSRKGRAPTMAAATNPRVQFIGLGVGDKPGALNDFRRTKWPMPWEHLVLPEQMDLDALNEAWGFDWYPYVILVDKDGIVVAVDIGLRGRDLLSTLRRHLGDRLSVESSTDQPMARSAG